jgi:hypothetical protein
MAHEVVSDAIEPPPHVIAATDLMSPSMRDEEDLLDDIIDVRACTRETLHRAEKKWRVSIEERRDIERGVTRPGRRSIIGDGGSFHGRSFPNRLRSVSEIHRWQANPHGGEQPRARKLDAPGAAGFRQRNVNEGHFEAHACREPLGGLDAQQGEAGAHREDRRLGPLEAESVRNGQPTSRAHDRHDDDRANVEHVAEHASNEAGSSHRHRW